MKPLYSPTTKGFYFKELHTGLMPTDVVPISVTLYKSLMDKQAEGFEVVPGVTGNPEAIKNNEKELQ